MMTLLLFIITNIIQLKQFESHYLLNVLLILIYEVSLKANKKILFFLKATCLPSLKRRV